MAVIDPYYAIQAAFTGGEISPDVASRVDLDKYQLALLKAQNAQIRPYGTVRKRPGSIYCGTVKNEQETVRLYRFEFKAELSYMIEFGVKYLRIWRDGKYLGIELETPYDANTLQRLRFAQSVDVLYIASGDYPVMKLMRYAENDWKLQEVEWTVPAFGDINQDEESFVLPGARHGTTTVEASKPIFTEDRIGDYLQANQYTDGENVRSYLTTGSGITKETDRFVYYSSSVCLGGIRVKTSGDWTGTVLIEAGVKSLTYQANIGTNVDKLFALPMLRRYKSGGSYHPDPNGKVKVRAQITGGTFHADIWTYSNKNNASGLKTGDVWDYNDTTMDKVRIGGTTAATLDIEVTAVEKITETIFIQESWKFISHGTWSGEVYIEVSYDEGETWRSLRKYTSKDDYNASESGTVSDPALLRLRGKITSGTCTADLSSYPERNIGWARIDSIREGTEEEEAGRSASVTIMRMFGSDMDTSDWKWSAWSKVNGYPRCVTFFQDRLCFGGSRAHPQRIWMSRTGDYENFEAQKIDGTVTDDSAITADLLALKAYDVTHMDVGTDLIVFTEGNTWSISGSETVKPSQITPRKQESYGTNDVIPIRVGNRVIYVQKRGSIVRDTGYSYDTDSYMGLDLTLLAKHLIKGRQIIDATYAQEPDSTLYFVTDDGKLLTLTYLIDQKVYAWTHYETDGAYEAVCAVGVGNNDVVYTVVNRTINGRTRRLIERFDVDRESSCQQDYIMMDAAVVKESETPFQTVGNLEHLDGKKVHVMADGYFYEQYTVKDGKIDLPQKVKRAIVGLPYTMILEQPSWDAGNTPSGTVQGRKKTVTTAIYRLQNSFGGKVGPDRKHLNTILYDTERLERGEDVLFSGDKKVTLGVGGFNTEGRTYLLHEEPYPFNVSAIIREVTFGG